MTLPKKTIQILVQAQIQKNFVMTQIVFNILPTLDIEQFLDRPIPTPAAAKQFVKTWVEEVCTTPADGVEALQVLHESFTAWCNEQDVRILSLGAFYRVMIQLGFMPTQVNTNKGVRRAFKGISIDPFGHKKTPLQGKESRRCSPPNGSLPMPMWTVIIYIRETRCISTATSIEVGDDIDRIVGASSVQE